MLVGRKRETAINARVAIFCLLAACCRICSANILTDIPKNNPLNIDWDPAPSPEDGPPLSAGASRDRSILPAQIGGIIGAYLFCVCIVGVALILIGRRLRHTIQRSAKALDIEMLVPQPAKAFEPSPSTPGNNGARNFSWPSPEKNDRNPYVFPTAMPRSPPGGEEPLVDSRVVEADREMLNRNLEDLYAHVMEQEEAKAAGVNPKELPLPVPLQTAGPVPLASPQRTNTPPKKKLEKIKPAKLEIDAKSPKPHSRSSSIISSLKSPRRKGIRGMRISSPIPTPLSAVFPTSAASDEEPLTPRFYSPPPPPPVPRDQIPYTHSRNTSSASPTRSIAEHLDYDTASNFHRPQLSQTSIYNPNTTSSNPSTFGLTQIPTSPIKQQHTKPRPQKPTLQPAFQRMHPNPTSSHPPSANSSYQTLPLPLRQYESFTNPQRSPSVTSPTFSQHSHGTNATKTTVLERTSPLSPGLNTAGQPRTPWSAGAVPYSPYQPFTPMIPVTPRLVTREERKEKKKMEGRAPVLEMIRSEGELWDSGY